MKRIVLAVMTATMLVNSAPAYAWDKHHCNVAVGESRAQKGKLLKECVGKFSLSKYTGLLNGYVKKNGGEDKLNDMPPRVKKVIYDASQNIKDASITWIDEDQQDSIDAAKLTAAIAGPILLAVSGAFILNGAIVFTAAAPVTSPTYYVNVSGPVFIN